MNVSTIGTDNLLGVRNTFNEDDAGHPHHVTIFTDEGEITIRMNRGALANLQRGIAKYDEDAAREAREAADKAKAVYDKVVQRLERSPTYGPITE